VRIASGWKGGLALVVAWASAAACVPKSKHEATTKKLEGQVESLEQERDRLKQEKAQLEADLQEKLKATEDELADLRKQREAQRAQLELFKKFTDKLKSMIDVGDIDVYMRRGRMVVGMPSQVLFPSGQHELAEKGKATLKKVATVLKELPERRFLVAGHTDNMPIGANLKTSYEDNWDLSTRRALVVTRFLIGEGVTPGALAATGYGEYDPTKSNKSAAGRKKNRRIEIIVEPLLAELPQLPEELAQPKDAKEPAKPEPSPAPAKPEPPAPAKPAPSAPAKPEPVKSEPK